MSYQYQSKTIPQLESLAEGLLFKYPQHIRGHYVNIEAILEEMGISLLPRPNLKKRTAFDAFLPRNAKYMLIDEDYGNDLPYFRLIISEEISHRVIEPELWENGVPEGANIYELNRQMYDDIEADAYRMALALLMPRKSYIDRFTVNMQDISIRCPEKNYDDKLKLAIDNLSNDFDVTFNAVASRGNHLQLFSGQIQKKVLPGAVVF